jgi:hypothetical protein
MIFTQEELPAELQERTVPGLDTRVEKPAADLRKADDAIRNAEILIRESEMAVEETEKADSAGERTYDLGEQSDSTVKQSGETQEKDVTPDNGTPAPLALSNSTEAVADDDPAQFGEEHPRNKFAVEADDKVWIQVRVDDKKTLSETLHAGDRREWPADKSLQVVIGNAGGIRMKWNEQPLKAPHDPGRVLRFRLPDYAKAE